MNGVEAAAFAAFDRRLDPVSKAPIAVAVSGGGDSIALLWLAAAWAGARRRPLLVIHVDHAINPYSKAWSATVREAATRAASGFISLEWQGPKPTTGLPAAARAARHALLADAARAAGVRVLLTGHTLDDVLEGDRMREADAPGLGYLREWTPSPAWPEGRSIFLLRPLLGIGREPLRDWLRARGEPWIEDPANADPRFARARARAHLSVSSSGEAKRRPEDPTAIDGEAVSHSSPRPRMTGDGRLILPRLALDAATLSVALLCAAGGDRPARGLQIEGLLDRLAGAAPVDATLAGARLVADADTVQIGRDAGERFRGGLAPLDLAANAPVVWDGRFEIAADVAGLQVAPLGGVIARLDRPNRAALKAVPPWARGAIPALIDANADVFLPRPLGGGPGLASPLAGPRLAAARGRIATECDIGDRPHGAEAFVTLCSAPLLPSSATAP